MSATSLDLDALGAALLGAVGANDEETEPKLWLDMGYAPLNKILSGYYSRGLPGGRLIEIAGPSASGKTLLATLAMIAAQRAGGIAVFIDWERAFNAAFAKLLGLDTNFPRFVYKRSETWEEGNTAALKVAETIRKKKLIAPEAPIVVVQDSIAASIPKSMLYDSKTGARRDIDEYTMNDTTALARVTSTTLKAVNQAVGEFDVTGIYLNQIRTKPGVVYGDPRTTPGGSAMEFYATTRIFTGRKLEKDKKEGGLDAAVIGLNTVKNKICMPFQEVELRLAYDDKGLASFDFTRGYIDELITAKKLDKDKSGRITFDGKTYFAGQLVEKINTEGRIGELRELLIGAEA
jgi:protein RecA